jgi:predicted nucleic acid-binding protein
VDRLFLDANVLFSAAYRPQNGLLALWKLKRVTLLSSPYAIEEAQRNLAEESQRSRLGRLVRSLEQIRTIPAQRLRVELPSKDEPILRAALAGRATHLITGDVKHFGKFFGQKLMGVLILPPGHYLQSL